MLDKRFFSELEKFVQRKLINDSFNVYESSSIDKIIMESMPESELEEFIESNRKPTFTQVLFGFIDESGASDPEIYHRAGIDRKDFSKIRSNRNYRPRKNTILALALALELSIHETDNLLNAAGYSLSESDTQDLIVQFCIGKNIFNIHDVNEALDYFDLDPLIG